MTDTTERSTKPDGADHQCYLEQIRKSQRYVCYNLAQSDRVQENARLKAFTTQNVPQTLNAHKLWPKTYQRQSRQG